MRRKILFRGKVKDIDLETCPEDGWVWGYYRQDISGGELRHYIFNCPMEWEVIPESVDQFTGLYDNSGVEIFFGDIVRDKYGDIGKVIWFSDSSIRVDWGGGDIHYIDLEWGLEVIGNIFDNSDLLSTKSE